MAVEPSTGWGVLHLFVHVDRDRAAHDPHLAKCSLDAIAALRGDDHQVMIGSALGHKADIAVMAVGPDLARLQQFQTEFMAGPLTLTWSFLSLTESSPYTSTLDDERARLMAEEQVTDAEEIPHRLAVWSERMEHYQEQRVHPRLPHKNVMCFYPMLKRRVGDDNWYSLPFADRKRLMGGHARTGRSYAGRVLQLITGATGMDDWEWGVTLFADDPVVIKDIVHEMRFDEVSARYAEFGPFIISLLGTPEAVFASVGLGTVD
jgi:hydrogen peroxide-dependent heme synthase